MIRTIIHNSKQVTYEFVNEKDLTKRAEYRKHINPLIDKMYYKSL